MNKHFGAVRAALRSTRLLRSLLVVGLVALGLPMLTMSPASAHTPNLTKSCNGVTVSGWAYEWNDTNTLGIQIDGGAWTTKSFGSSDSLTVAVPQDGVVHSYKAYVHTSNWNPVYSKDYSGQVGPCGDKHVTAVLWDRTDPTCATDGALVPKDQPEGITVHKSPSGTGPGHYTITFEPEDGYVIDGPKSQTIDVLPKLTGDQCATEVQPVEPVITHPACTGPGTGTPGTFTLPPDGGGIGYTKAGNVVTAAADATHKLVSLPAGWTLVDSHHATYTVSYDPPAGYPACLDELPTPVPPVASAPTCDTDGDLVVGTTAHVVTRVDGVVVTEDTHFGAGTHELSYTAAPGYTFAGGANKTFEVEVEGKTLDCPVTPVNPSVTQSVCSGPGTHTDPVVTPGDLPGDHITYVYDAVAHVVTATPDAGFALVDLPEGWVKGDGSATFLVDLVDPGPCLEEIAVPAPPAPTEPTCDVDGVLTVAPADHVVTTVDGEVVDEETDFGPGEHTVAYAPATGYAFVAEAVTAWDVEVLPSTKDCPTGVVAPSVTQSVCTGPGTHSDPVVTPGDVESDHVSYAYDAIGRVVTATPDAGFVLAGLADTWTLLENGSATYAVTLTDPGPCLVTVVEPPASPPGHTPAVAGPTPATLPNTGGPSGRVVALGLVLLLGGGALAGRDISRRLRTP